MSGNPLEDGVRDALAAAKDHGENIALGPPPGAKPLPWKDQVVQFLDVLPDLLTNGPEAQQIDAREGQGAAQKYLRTMLAQIARPRERRRPM